jgi:hypothetical protein
MMLKAKMDTAMASKAIQEGRMPSVMQAAMEQLKPEAAYFGPEGGQRTAFIIFDMDDPSQLPVISEPLFSQLGATVEFFPVMDRNDLERGLKELGSQR